MKVRSAQKIKSLQQIGATLDDSSRKLLRPFQPLMMSYVILSVSDPPPDPLPHLSAQTAPRSSFTWALLNTGPGSIEAVVIHSWMQTATQLENSWFPNWLVVFHLFRSHVRHRSHISQLHG